MATSHDSAWVWVVGILAVIVLFGRRIESWLENSLGGVELYGPNEYMPQEPMTGSLPEAGPGPTSPFDTELSQYVGSVLQGQEQMNQALMGQFLHQLQSQSSGAGAAPGTSGIANPNVGFQNFITGLHQLQQQYMAAKGNDVLQAQIHAQAEELRAAAAAQGLGTLTYNPTYGYTTLSVQGVQF